MTAHADLIKASELVLNRLLMWKETAEAARDRGEAFAEFVPAAMWEPEDQSAVDAYNDAKQRLLEELA
jgi:hypothetical protein